MIHGQKNIKFSGKVKKKRRCNYPFTGLDRSLGILEVEAPRISRQSAHENGKVFSPKHRPPLSPGDIPLTHLR